MKSQELLDKVYAYLDTIDVTKLSMSELKDFLGVVQQGQFLETTRKMPSFGFGSYTPMSDKDICDSKSTT